MFSFVSVAFLLLAVHSATSLNCYSCNSKDSAFCDTGFFVPLSAATEQCGSAGFLDGLVGPKCYKIIATKNGEKFVARGCQNPPAFGCNVIAKGISYIGDLSNSGDISCETCETDKCNSASKVVGFTLLGIILAIFAFVF